MLLDLAVGGLALQVLERGEPDQRVGAVGGCVPLGDRGVAVDELPALEVDVGEQVFLPGSLDGWFVGQDQHRVQPISRANWYVVNVLPKRILAFQRNLDDLSPACAVKYPAVSATAYSCSGRIPKSCVRAESK